MFDVIHVKHDRLPQHLIPISIDGSLTSSSYLTMLDDVSTIYNNELHYLLIKITNERDGN